ncbi:hypothetical protein SISSUDRAFT_1121145 [Sistotremastrum suecicum HHB10207 ss-3]|uniref:Uncharacterized protein n=1 Tax=Sistotremastrum suecicum HHB10207 ss-3 TaxID=1314776 RepID=A0A166BAN5_9AGAM|nr:hypothetical protein SISSUDRAFT_1121145 [Sistotremastrum suecicum HHB10207 ss-3]
MYHYDRGTIAWTLGSEVADLRGQSLSGLDKNDNEAPASVVVTYCRSSALPLAMIPTPLSQECGIARDRGGSLGEHPKRGLCIAFRGLDVGFPVPDQLIEVLTLERQGANVFIVWKHLLLSAIIVAYRTYSLLSTGFDHIPIFSYKLQHPNRRSLQPMGPGTPIASEDGADEIIV